MKKISILAICLILARSLFAQNGDPEISVGIGLNLAALEINYRIELDFANGGYASLSVTLPVTTFVAFFPATFELSDFTLRRRFDVQTEFSLDIGCHIEMTEGLYLDLRSGVNWLLHPVDYRLSSEIYDVAAGGFTFHSMLEAHLYAGAVWLPGVSFDLDRMKNLSLEAGLRAPIRGLYYIIDRLHPCLLVGWDF